MAKMIPLDPAPSAALPLEGWTLIATEAGRYAKGLVATLQAHNGTLQVSQQLPLAHPRKWKPFVADVVDRSGCPMEVVEAAIRELVEAIEVLLRSRQAASRTSRGAPTRARAEGRPRVQVNARFLRNIMTDAVVALIASNEPPTIFVRGSMLVRVPPDGTHAEPLSIAALRVFLDQAADFVVVRVTDEGGEVEEPARPPHDVCESLLAVPPLDAFPRLASIRSAPVLLPDGRLLTEEGYDRQSGILLRVCGLDGVSDDMAPEEAKEWLFRELLGDFPFADEPSRAHALALILEPFVWPRIHGPTPLYLIDAPIRGAGKGLLADSACVIATGQKADVMALVSGNAEEHEKRITALLVAGAQWILIDNATSLASAPLAAVLTTTRWRGRRLGRSEIVDVPNDATWVATGNNVELSDELARRTIPIRLDPGIERPEDRTGFAHPELVKWAREHRPMLVSACLSLIRAWMDAGCPEGAATLGSYESWARVLGGILGVSGISGFLGGRERLYSDADRETGEWRALCDEWWETHGGHPVTAKEVFKVAKRRELLLHVWAGRKDLAAQQRLGHALAGVRDRVFGRFRVHAAGRDSQTGNAAYRLEPVADPNKILDTPETPRPAMQLDAAQGDLCLDTPGVVRDDAPKTPGDTGRFADGPAAGSRRYIEQSIGYGVSGVLGVWEPSCPGDANTQNQADDEPELEEGIL